MDDVLKFCRIQTMTGEMVREVELIETVCKDEIFDSFLLKADLMLKL